MKRLSQWLQWLAGATACVALLACSSPVADSARQVPERETQVTASQPGEIRLSDEGFRRAGIETRAVEEAPLPLELTVSAQVTLDQDRTVRVGAFAGGIVVECCRSLGSYVREGDILATIHSHQAHEILAEYWRARESVDARNAEFAYAEQAYRRASRLYELKAGSLQRVQQAETALSQAETARNTAQVAQESARAHLKYLGIDLASLQQEDAPDRGSGSRLPADIGIHVRSPIEGTVVSRSVTPGAVVKPTDELYRVSNLNRVWAIAQVPEQHLSRLRQGMEVELHVGAYPDTGFPGRISRVADELDPQTRTVQVRCEIPNPRQRLKASMYGTILLRSNHASRGLIVPDRAVQTHNGGHIVFVPLGERSFQVRRVQLGRTADASVEITGGLEAGDRVVVSGAFVLKSEMLKEQIDGE